MKTQLTKRIAKPDILLLGLLLAIGAASFLAVRMRTNGHGAAVRVLADGELYGTYSLSDTLTVPIEKDGLVTNTLQIAGGKANMAGADCPDKLCVHQKAISRQGETIVCLPNKIVVEIQGGQDTGLDSISR